MGRPEEALQRDGSLIREFAFWLRDLRNCSGLTYHQLARLARYSPSTLQSAAAGHALPTLKVTLAFAAACGADLAAWQDYWTQVKRALDADSPRKLTVAIQPPWAQGTDLSMVAAPDAGGETRIGVSNSSGVVTLGGAAQVGSASRAEAANPTSAWYVESFYALLRMDTPQPEAVEHRVIVALEDGLQELATSVSVPRAIDDDSGRHQLDAELLFGGSLELREQPFESYFRHVIALASPLNAGQRHEYQLRLRVPPGQLMAPHYAYVPFCRSEYFQLRVRFPADRLPSTIRVLNGTPPAVIYESGPDGTLLVPDRFGEVSVEFRGLMIGHSYGMRWRY
jgi:transcriptional regulator with XRE-family HTH domain